MDDNFIFYFSINDLLKNKDLINLIKNESFNSYEEYNTTLWGNNNNIVGNITYKIEIKNIIKNNENNFYTDGVIIVLLNNSANSGNPFLDVNMIESGATKEQIISNIRYEIPIFKLQDKINLFTDNYNTIIDYYYLNNVKLEQKIEVNIESFIKTTFLHENLFYSIISIKKI